MDVITCPCPAHDTRTRATRITRDSSHFPLDLSCLAHRGTSRLGTVTEHFHQSSWQEMTERRRLAAVISVGLKCCEEDRLVIPCSAISCIEWRIPALDTSAPNVCRDSSRPLRGCLVPLPHPSSSARAATAGAVDARSRRETARPELPPCHRQEPRLILRSWPLLNRRSTRSAPQTRARVRTRTQLLPPYLTQL